MICINKNIALISLLLLISYSTYSQDLIYIYGFIKDQQTGEVLPGATIYDTLSGKGVISDYNGYFNIKTSTPSTLRISYVGYTTKKLSFQKSSDTLITVFLKTTNILDEVIITERRTKSGNLSTLSQKEFIGIPSLGGKPDVAKALQLLPGINTQTEGSSLLQVRGGDPGQNLYLFDNVSIIYVNHIGGFMSVFAPDIINNIDVYKGSFPARYGGKLSSIVDITQKQGNDSKLMGNYSIGITDVSFFLEGPTKIENSSFIITTRKTLTDPLMYLVSNISEENDFSIAYGFHDLNSKFTWNPNERNSLNLNLYYGDDYLKHWQSSKSNINSEKFKHSNTWGNLMLSGHWKTVLNSRLYSKTILSYSRYRLKNKYSYSLENAGLQTDYFNKNLSSVNDISVNSSLKHSLSKNINNEYGIKSAMLYFLPFYSEQNNAKQINEDYIRSNETAFFASTKILFLEHSDIHAGVRGVGFYSNRYFDYSIEPRLELNLGINEYHNFNAGFMKTWQYSHLLLSSGSIMLNEVWIPASEEIQPSAVTQYNFGYNMGYKAYLLRLDFYHKEMFCLATYKDGYTAFEGDDNWKTKVETNGMGKSQGLELYFKKTTGNLTGFTSYTLSKTTRQYPNINDGFEYLFDYDRTHSFSTYINYKINQKFDFNLTWIYQTGLPYTPAIGKTYAASIQNGETVYYEKLVYGEKNSQRMRDYHRLDIGINYATKNKKDRKAVWSFSVYNLYNRQNPNFYYYNTNNTGEIRVPEIGSEILELKLYQISLFSFIPSVSYKVYFEKGEKMREKKKRSFKNWLYQID